SSYMGWIGVDLDGTLAKYKSGQGSKIGDPVPQMVSKLKDWHKEKQEVRIFTARAETLHGKNEVINWLKKNNLPSFTVTNIKDSKMIELWDDKAIRVEKNQGKACSGCASSSREYHSAVNNDSYLTDC
ncbi:TPA: hypothetical protein ACIO77_004354, partial [Salmonella enterica subsp. enterica serovar Wangata]